MTKRGRVDPLFLGSNGFDVFYDLDSLEPGSKWYTHQSVLAKIALDGGNSTIVVKRIIDEDSKTADVCVGVHGDSNKIGTVSVESLHKDEVPNDFIPLMEFSAADPGDWGNRIGLQVFKASDKIQNTMGTAMGAVIYSAVVMEEDELSGKHRVINNLYGEPVTHFTTKRDTIYNGVAYYFDDIMSASYIEHEGEITRPENFGHFKLYPDMFSAIANNPNKYWEEDVLSDMAPNGPDAFRDGMTIFARGGDDGFINSSASMVENRLDRVRKYEEACRLWLSGIDETNPICDMAQYPFSTLWDSGFTKDVKLEFKNVLLYRKDVWIAMAVTSANRYYEEGEDTYFDYQDKLSTQEAISLSMYYRGMFSGIPESVAFGTPTVRATLVGQDGVNRNSLYRKRQTINVDLFEKIVKYCGRGTGKWHPSYAFDQRGLNTLTNWQDVSMDYFSPPAADDAWDAGLIYVQNKDTRNKFYPAYQTLYPDDTSVLNNIFTMMACCWIEKQHHKGWTMTTGDSKSTNLEIAERLDQYLNSSLMNAFDGRFTTVSKTYYTESDTANGFSFTTETTIYSNMSKHTANYKISAYRMSDFLN